jgi:hypothetical protein
MNRTYTTEPPRDDLLDLLDEALYRLKTSDRDALVLHYLNEQPMSDVAGALGVSQDAARKRVERAVEKLRDYFLHRGITASSVSLAAILTQQIPGAALAPALRQSIVQGIVQLQQAGMSGTAASVSIAKGTKTMMTLAKIKTASATVAAAVAILIAGRMIAQVTAGAATPTTQSAMAAPTNAPSASAVAAKTAAPASAPANVDLSTPEAAAKSFFTAVKNSDRAGTYACLTADPNRSPNLLDAMLAWNFAQNRLTHAVIQSFGGDGSAVRRLYTIDMVADAILMNQAFVPATINGDSATFTIVIPPGLTDVLPANFRQIINIWSNKQLRFQKENGTWKFNIDHSIRIEANGIDINKKPVGASDSVALMLDYAWAMDEVTKSIADGLILSARDASTALDTATAQADHKHAIVQMQVNILPVN